MGGTTDSGAAERAAENERKKIEAEQALEKMKADQTMLSEKKATAAKEAADRIRSRSLLGMDEEDEGTTTLKKSSTLLGS